MTKMRRRSIIAIAVAGTCIATVLLIWRISIWNLYTGEVTGVVVEGDATAPPTHWWNHFYLAKWGWKSVAVFEVSREDARAGYDVGYLPYDGEPRVEGKTNHEQRYRMKVGHEDCTFFAISVGGKEILLKLIARTTIDDASYKDVPLH